ncbi:PQQ-binding-like beta-propeller repeat protein [Streptomyces sp. NPDC058308]|uniref:outer membrane protein assembly factor BamB family protein n=1 Tax=Streptomyces sp. NPDC058308 TaxID=3346440 RepID=UPI0036E05240
MSFGPPPPPSPSPYTQSTLAVGAREKRRTVFVFGVVLALTAALFAGGWAVWSLTEEKGTARASAAQQPPDAIRETVETVPKTPEGQVAVGWTEKLKEGRSASTKGTWVSGSIAAKSFADVIRGMEIGTAEKKWEIQFAGPLCAVTRHVSVDGRTAVAVPGKRSAKEEHAKGEKGARSERPCDHLAVVDIDSGKKLWEEPLPVGDSGSSSVNVTMTRGTVVASWGRGSAAYDMTTGERLWSDVKARTCNDVGFAGGRGLLALQSCGDSADRLFRVQKVAPRTGRAEWTHRVAEGIESVYLASSEPAVIAVATGDEGVIDYLHSLDDRGRNRATIPLPDRRYVHNCDETFSAEVERCSGVVVGRRQLYMATKPRDMYEPGLTKMPPNEIVAFDLRTGNSVLKFDAKPDRPMYPVRMSGDNVIAYRENAGAALSSVVSLDPETGKERLLLVLPDDADRPSMDLFANDFDIVYERGTVVFGMKEVERQSGEQDEGPQVSLMDGYRSSG